MLAHPFLTATAEGRIPDAAFATWMQQDYLFVAQAIRFFSILKAEAPKQFPVT
jgi:formylaminopyrimidine deformylase / aminopyrimidine aminohydrolase